MRIILDKNLKDKIKMLKDLIDLKHMNLELQCIKVSSREDKMMIMMSSDSTREVEIEIGQYEGDFSDFLIKKSKLFLDLVLKNKSKEIGITIDSSGVMIISDGFGESEFETKSAEYYPMMAICEAI